MAGRTRSNMSRQILSCLLIILLLPSSEGFGDALTIDKKSENSIEKRNIFHMNSQPAEQSRDHLKSVGPTQILAFRAKNPFRKPTSKSDGLTDKENKSQEKVHVDHSTKSIISWLGIKIRTILRRLVQPVRQYLALTRPPIQSKPSLDNDRDYSQLKSNELNRNSAENEVNTLGKILKIEIPTQIDEKIPDANEFESRKKIVAALGFHDRPTRRLTRRSINDHLAKEFEARRSSELEGDSPAEGLFKPKKLHPIPTGDKHVDGLFLDKNFLMGVSYFVHHPDRMSSADAPGIVGIGKLRPTRPPSTTTSPTARSVVKTARAKTFGSDASTYRGGSSEEEMDITHEYTKTVESHKSKIKSRRKHKNYEHARNSVNMSAKSKHVRTFPSNKQSKTGTQYPTQRPFLFMSSTQTPQVSSYRQPVTQVNYGNEVTFSTGVYRQSYFSTTPRTDNGFLNRNLNPGNQPYYPGSYHDQNRVSTSEKPSNLQQFITDPTEVVLDPQNADRNNQIFQGANTNQFSNLNSIDNGNLFGNGMSKRPNSWLQQQLNNLNINIFSKGKMYSPNPKDLAQEQTYRLHQPFSNVPTVTGAQGTFPDAYKQDMTNMYGPRVESFWNQQSPYLDSNNPVMYSYENWRNGRFPVVSAF